MGILRKNPATDEVAESGRMTAEDLVAPVLERKADDPPAPQEQPEQTGGQAETGESKQPEKPKNEGPAKVIAFANQKGGVAKTTTALNLAVAFKESGHRVLAVDMDPQGNLTMSQGVDPDKVEKSMFDVLVHRFPISE